MNGIHEVVGSTPFTSKLVMSDKGFDTGKIDPEIADLLGNADVDTAPPDFSELFKGMASDSQVGQAKQKVNTEVQAEDFIRKEFPKIGKWKREPDPVFSEKNYYSKVLADEGEIANRVHTLLQKFLKIEDPQERGLYRQRLITAWWELASNLASHYQGANVEKRWALRFGYFLPALISSEQRQMLASVIPGNEYDEPIHYVDEWFDLILEGKVNPLATDEPKSSKSNIQTKTKNLLEKAKGSKEVNLTMLRTLGSNRDEYEADLNAQIHILTRHDAHPSVPGIRAGYTPDQVQALSRVQDIVRKLSKLDKDIHHNIERYAKSDKDLDKLGNKIEQMGDLNLVDRSAIENELGSVRQMAKLCVGRQGNHIPFLMKNFFPPKINLIGTRENVISCMRQVEMIDPEVFKRSFRQRVNRIVPHTIIVPCYGERGICWEPFERFNRSTSRGRIVVPMFPKNLKLAVIYALGDLRWNLAKEKAAHYWMEEGLTGHYYQWFSAQKNKGDVRLSFLESYVLWITKESEGMQKLEREVRGIFWRDIPFNSQLKESLRNRGFVYDELFKKDINREMSDGY